MKGFVLGLGFVWFEVKVDIFGLVILVFWSFGLGFFYFFELLVGV